MAGLYNYNWLVVNLVGNSQSIQLFIGIYTNKKWQVSAPQTTVI